MAADAGGSQPVGPAPRTLLDLPAETQHSIVSHSDLICLALVCRRLHELASAQLYRNFHIVFPDDDDIIFDSPIDGLAGGLDTFTTSDYNYARHLRDLSMDTLSAGPRGEHSYQPYLYSASCGKFLNSLLHLTLKKAKSLEVFRWNIRVELSRPVYHQLHRIASLTRLHVRMQAGDSYYSPPPPLSILAAAFSQGPAGHLPVHLPPPVVSSPSLPSGGPPPVLVPPSSKPTSRARAARRGLAPVEPSTFSGFKGLKALSVLDIDSVDVVDEIKTCVKNSFSTLKELQLSLSDTLAQQARKPLPDSDADDSDDDDDDDDDEFQMVPTSHIPSYDTSAAAKAFRAQEERNIQEGILGKILDIEKMQVKKRPQAGAPETTKAGETKESSPPANPRDNFISSIKSASARLMALKNGSRDFSTCQHDILDTIERAARLYVDSCDSSPPQGQEGVKASSDSPAAGTRSEDDLEPGPAQSGGPDRPDAGEQQGILGRNDSDNVATGASSSGKSRDGDVALRPSSTGLSRDETNPDDIDIAHVDGLGEAMDNLDDQIGPGTSEEEQAHGSQPTSALPGVSEQAKATGVTADEARQACCSYPAQEAEFRSATERLRCLQRQLTQVAERLERLRCQEAAAGYRQTEASKAELQLICRSVGDISNEMRAIEAEDELLRTRVSAQLQELKPGEEGTRRSMEAYVRDTRGLLLESLSLHLVPVKASVLLRGVDVCSLRQLTLLNVGNQAPIWTLLAKEGKTRPLALRSVFTDHVTTSFLSSVAQLPELHDLFLLERGVKHRPESFAPRTTTTMDQIRRLVLKRHMPTLRRLMIKDESTGVNWDANEKTMILICSRGARLEELALSMNINAVHAFMQYFSGLVSLRAINILHFKNNDTCIWVMREILRFIVDNLSHHPELKLEWIAMEDDRVERVVRPSEAADERPEAQPAKRAKGKAKTHAGGGATAMSATAAAADGAYPLLPVDGLDSESESEDEGGLDSGARLRFKTVGPLQFYDVWGIRIFEKEIRSGRL